ncbi:hypothetical protein BaRGS_00002090 [Batillaria attramentaria]|uniref:Uncharacterized protein n=1 Tax=Batillaria attramentaria TaxID=370345 RepID=A0ABD0M3Y2_9CAEN
MLARVVLGLSVVVLGVYVFLYRPEPFGRALDTTLVAAAFYLSIAAVSYLALFWKRPVKFIDPAGKSVLITVVARNLSVLIGEQSTQSKLQSLVSLVGSFEGSCMGRDTLSGADAQMH